MKKDTFLENGSARATLFALAQALKQVRELPDIKQSLTAVAQQLLAVGGAMRARLLVATDGDEALEAVACHQSKLSLTIERAPAPEWIHLAGGLTSPLRLSLDELKQTEWWEPFLKGASPFSSDDGEWVAIPLKDQGGRTFGLCQVARTGALFSIEQRHAVEALVEFAASHLENISRSRQLSLDETWFHTMAEAAPALIWASGTDKLCHYFNRTWLEYTGRSLAEEMGNGWTEGVHPDDYDRCLRIYTGSFDARQPFEMDYRLRKADGTYGWILDRAAPVILPNGSFIGYIGACVEITARKETERLLEEKVMARTQELQTLVTQVETLNFAISHDMRASLRAVRQYAEILLEEQAEEFNPDATEYLRRISSAGRRMHQLLEDILAHGRLLRGPMNLTEVSLDAILSDLLQQEPELAAHRDCIHVSKPLPKVTGNSTALTQSLRNLLVNAVKYRRPDVKLQVEVGADVDERGVRVWIRDNGLGVPPNDRERIWDLFERGERNNAGPEGTGLGLAIVKAAVTRMGGEVGLEAVPGHEGTLFWIRLPKASG